MGELQRGWMWILVAYAAAIVAGAGVLFAPVPLQGYVLLFAADIVATVVIFGFSLAFRNGSFYDAYWSVIPPLLAAWWMLDPAATLGPRQALVLLAVLLWAVRLTVNWGRGWTGLDHEDWRYIMLREQTGPAYPLVNLFGIHVFPTVQVFLGCLPLAPALVWGSRPLNVLDGLAAVIAFGAIAINHVADEQLRSFRATATPESVLDSGIWSWSRHPNYFGEMGFWWGLALFAIAADPTSYWTAVGAFTITAMFVGISIPMIEKRMLAKRPAYAEVQKRVWMIVPLPPRS